MAATSRNPAMDRARRVARDMVRAGLDPVRVDADAVTARGRGHAVKVSFARDAVLVARLEGFRSWLRCRKVERKGVPYGRFPEFLRDAERELASGAA